jgi:hypothetical protein
MTEENKETAVTVAVDVNNTETALAIAGSKGFLSRLQLMTSNTQVCKDGKFPINHFAIVEGSESFIDLGDRVAIHVYAHRALALEFGETVMAVYDAKIIDGKPTGEFARIAKKADGGPNSQAMYGVQFLLYVPSQKAFVTFFCGTKTLRNEIKAFLSKMNQDAMLIPKKIETKAHSWFTAVVTQCSEALDGPDEAVLADVIADFKNPPAEVKERIEEAAERG